MLVPVPPTDICLMGATEISYEGSTEYPITINKFDGETVTLSISQLWTTDCSMEWMVTAYSIHLDESRCDTENSVVLRCDRCRWKQGGVQFYSPVCLFDPAEQQWMNTRPHPNHLLFANSTTWCSMTRLLELMFHCSVKLQSPIWAFARTLVSKRSLSELSWRVGVCERLSLG